MDIEYLQTQRYKLQKRFRRVNGARSSTYHVALLHFWQFLEANPLFSDIIEILSSQCEEAEEIVRRIVEDNENLLGDTEEEAAAMGLAMIQRAVQSDDPRFAMNVVLKYNVNTRGGERTQIFTEMFVEPFYEYLDEAVDDRGVTLALLRRYKRRCEWFERERLMTAWTDNTKIGEQLLARDLYRYLYDQGLEFFIEPSSASGQVDMISLQEGDDRLLVDAKVFNPSKSKGRPYLAEGVKQLYTYCVDYDQPVGYLAIFKTSKHDLRFLLKEGRGSVPRVIYNHKVLFLLTIDIFPHPDPASKRGAFDPYEVKEEDLVGDLDQSP